ncbi:MAG: VIT and VWA domain-containing protein [Bacteroidales bacterium]|nr:VIT and VWA domain-containing protein [Bacteroidales bacterium]
MKVLKYFTISIVLIIVLIPTVVISNDKTQSPYFFVSPGDSTSTPKMPLLHTEVQVSVEGVIAHVTVSQVYVNSGITAIEAVYVFPGSSRAAVHGMNMRIGKREIKAQIQEKMEARKQYEKAKKEGKTASLLEQLCPNVFKMKVGNIMPNDTIEVELVYTELLVPEKGIYEFVYPTVVGPRYTGGGNKTETTSELHSISYSGENIKPTYSFDAQIIINAGIPVAKAQCSTHKMNKTRDGNTVRLLLDETEKYGANRDLMVQYSLRGNKIQTGMLMHEGEHENFFLMMIQPPENISEKQIVPCEYVFILDVSGSMDGFPLDISKALFKKLVKELRPMDKFNLLAFAGGSEVLSENMLKANKENIAMAVSKVNRFQGGGSTNLLPALQNAYQMTGESNSSKIFVILTDGYVTVEQEAFQLIRENLNKASVFTFGIGSSVNRYLLEGMA